ncbi:hypothetical protein [Shinella oryzae]|uniref:Uncharacterized protein n=1 Tax=Shinella oryzae TaxID=2871820 RepID=A0ABY9K0N9_9HYPH|nr:hypothetical protein [Shinella oryzae]WLS02155.1 hypothetical protein Q9315_11990 [Shinella oryzae]
MDLGNRREVKRITPAGGGDPAGVIDIDWQLGGGVLPIDRRGAGRRSAPLRIPSITVSGNLIFRLHAGPDHLAFPQPVALSGASLRLDHHRSDDCNIAGSFGFVQCNMVMDGMRCLHAAGIGSLRPNLPWFSLCFVNPDCVSAGNAAILLPHWQFPSLLP